MIFTILALVGAIVSSYTDLKNGIIPNKLTMSLFVIGVLGHLIFNGKAIISPLIQSVGLIFVLGYGFWFLGGWSAGDAKEFLFLAALLPVYPPELLRFFQPSLAVYPFILTIFINTFLAIFPFLLIWGIYISFKQAKMKEFLAPIKDIRDLGINAAYFTSAVLLTILLKLPTILALPVVLISYKLSTKIKIIFAAIIAPLFLITTVEPLFIFKYFFGVFLAYLIFRLFWNSINIVRKGALLDLVKIEDLKEGMVPSEVIYMGENKIENKARGLSMDEIERLKNFEGNGKISEIKIKKTTPFAPVILIGLLISLAIGDIPKAVLYG